MKQVNKAQVPRYRIGIDPGVSTGLAIWDSRNKKFELLMTSKIHVAMDFIREFFDQNKSEGVFVTVEDARLRGHGYNDNGLTDAKKMGAGSVRRDSSIWDDFLSDEQIPYKMKKPNGKSNELAKNKNLKIFQLNTKYTERCSEHARCAAMLVWNS